MEIREDNRFLKGLTFGILIGVLIMLLTACYFNPELFGQKPQEETESQEVTQYDEEKARLKKLGDVQKLIESVYLFEYDEEDFTDWSCKGLVAALDDPYSTYFTKEEYDDMMETSTGVYYGIGIMATQNMETGEISVVQVFDGSPAREVGMMEKDIIVAVSGEPVTGMDLSLVVTKIKGQKGEKVDIEVYRPSTKEYIDFAVERREVERDTIEFKMLEHNIGYIKLTEFDEVSYEQFMAAYNELTEQGMEGLVFDLRNNPGGLLGTVVSIADEFLPEGKILYTEDKNGEGETYSSKEETQLNIPLAVLINGQSASASEVLAGAIKDYEWGTLVGTTSFGKGIVQRIFPFRDGTALKLTTSHYFTPNGHNIHGTGITPDIVVEAVEGETDNQLEVAIQNVLEQMNEE